MNSSDDRPAGATFPSGTFCVLPWMHVFADERGVMFPCCRSVDTLLSNADEAGRPYRVQDPGGIEQGWNSAYMRTLRRGMLAGDRPAPCQRCYAVEDVGMQSYRHIVNGKYEDRVPELLARTDEAGGVPADILSFDLRLGNVCNLRCRMCSPQSTRLLIREWAEFYGVSPDHAHFEQFRHLDWFADPGFWTIFEKHSARLEQIHFAGGEPLLIPQMFDFLARLIAAGRAPRIRLSYNTNLTVLPERVVDLWAEFASVRVTVSLDGYEGVNSFIRHPADWKIIDRNLRRLDAERERLNCTGGLTVNTTVQVYNIFRLDELLEYAASNFEHLEAPNLSLLRYPEHLSVQILPREMKEQAAARLRGFTERFADRWPERWKGAQLEKLLASIQGSIQHMMNADRSDLLPEFVKWNGHFDRSRGQLMSDAIPELAPLLAGP